MSGRVAPDATQRLRPEIQGLRAVAVGAVLVYHLWPARLPGGFVGVDVFFVISGYLIGSHLLAELAATGRVRLGRFWSRRATRLLPASLLVLLVVALATMAFAPLSTRADFLHQVVGSTFYVQNWVLAADSVDYLAAGDAVSPVQHFWSLSAEEQFYVALPLVLAAVAVVSATGRRRRRTTVLVLAALGAASLLWSVLQTRASPGVAYFSTATRAWEFLAGVLLAGTVLRLPRRIRALLGGAGVVAILVTTLVLDGSAPFPGILAAVPVLGALMVIVAGDAGPMALACRLRPVTWLGDVSYAVYLWHWPLIVLVPYATGEPLDSAAKVGIVAVSLLLAQVSTRWFEAPVRRQLGRAPTRWVGAAVLTASLVVGGTAVLGARVSTGEQARLEAAAQTRLLGDDARCLGAAAMDPAISGCGDLGTVLVPAPASAGEDDANRTECWAPYGVSTPQVCSFGPDDSDTRVLAVGDSHNNVLIPVYEALADQLGWRIDVTGRADCSWGTRRQSGRTTATADECAAWKQAIADRLAAGPAYDTIITTSLQSGYPAVPEAGETEDEATVAGLVGAWSGQIARGSVVVAIDDNPAARPDVVQCVEREGIAGARTCARTRARATGAFDSLAAAVAETPGSALVSLRDLMCTARLCPPVIGNVVVYRDRTHLTATFVRTLTPYVVSRLLAAQAQARATHP